MAYISRQIFSQIHDHLDKKEYSILVGARQVGKTTLLRELYRQLKKSRKKVFFLTFENSDILREINIHPENVFRFVDRPTNPLDNIDIEEGQKVYLLIDEIQYANDPSGFLKYLYDTYLQNLKIIATGSSAFYIDHKFKDSLAGRKKIIKIYSLNFQEYLTFNGRDDLAQELELMRNRLDYISLSGAEIKELFDQYLVYGGYPAVALEKDIDNKKELLYELRDSYLRRDMLEAGIRKKQPFYNLLSILSDQIGNLMNKNELSNTLQLHNETLSDYLHILEKSFHIGFAKPFYKNIRKELIKMPKIYFIDQGFRNAVLNRFHPINTRSDKGALLENYLFLKLKLKYPHDNIRFWRTTDGHELDFVISNDFTSGHSYEVKYSRDTFKKAKYKKFMEHYPDIPVEIVTHEKAVRM
jgi:uncharacterized protein